MRGVPLQSSNSMLPLESLHIVSDCDRFSPALDLSATLDKKAVQLTIRRVLAQRQELVASKHHFYTSTQRLARGTLQRPFERDDLLVKQLLQLLAVHVILHEVKLEKVRVQRLRGRLVLGVMVSLQIRVLQALVDSVSLSGID